MLKPYNEYRYFGLPWLEEIPSYWTMMRNKNVLIEKKEVVGSSANNYLLLSLTLNGVIARDMINAKGKFPKDFNTYKVVEPGNLIFCLFDIDETPRTVGLSPLNGMITGAYDVFQPVNINGKYLYYYYLSIDNVKGLKPLYTGLRKVINIQTFLGTKLPVPPKEEQNQIVRFLDWKLAKINKLIRAKKKQIALLNEQRQVIIHNAVTKGVDPNVMMKDSGIEWISKIPTSWKKDKITRLFNIIGSGTTPSSGNSIYYENPTTPWINSGDLYSDTMYLSNTNKSVSQRAIDDYSVLKIYPSNTIVIAMYGASIGNLAITEIPACCNQACCCLSEIDQRLDIKYAYYLLKACKSFWIEKSKGGGQPNISQDIIKQTWLPLPPKTEQIKISQFLSYYESHFHRAIETIKHEIILIQEFRTRLISDVVTGKVDVRDIEIPEYEADSDETIDDEIDDNLVLDEEDGEMEVE